jgi:hypothetical protein
MVQAVKTFSNNDSSFQITVLEDISYQVIENGLVVRTAEMDKWYRFATSLITHIEKDIKNGYYPKLKVGN